MNPYLLIPAKVKLVIISEPSHPLLTGNYSLGVLRMGRSLDCGAKEHRAPVHHECYSPWRLHISASGSTERLSALVVPFEMLSDLESWH